jgi:hypothetical protein
MYTPYNKNNADMSDGAHRLAVTKLYPQLFGVSPERLEFDKDTLLGESARGEILDGQMGVDYVARLTVEPLGAPLQVTIQERFRRYTFAKYRDVTLTEWNHNTNLPSELFKITSGIFLYGYVNERQDDFLEAIAFNVTDLMVALAKGSLSLNRERNPRSNQSFVCFTFEQLMDAGVVMFHYTPQRSNGYVLPSFAFN